MTTLRLGTRASKLAMIQAEMVAAMLRDAHPGIEVEIVPVSTAGDRDKSSPLTEGVGWFTSALQDALRAGEIDLAVHSHKDLPTAQPPDLVIAAVPSREDPRDVFVGRGGASLADLPAGAVVGTSSPRREAQVRALRPDVAVRPIRGNVDTRLAKIDAGDYDGTVLALAGLRRLGREDEASEVFEPERLLPAPAQGALAVECRTGDTATRDLLAAIDDETARATVTAERTFLATLRGGCSVAAGAHAALDDDEVTLDAMLAEDGRIHRETRRGPREQSATIGRELAERLLAARQQGR